MPWPIWGVALPEVKSKEIGATDFVIRVTHGIAYSVQHGALY